MIVQFPILFLILFFNYYCMISTPLIIFFTLALGFDHLPNKTRLHPSGNLQVIHTYMHFPYPHALKNEAEYSMRERLPQKIPTSHKKKISIGWLY